MTEKDYRECVEKYGDKFKAGMGAEAIKELLQQIDLEELSADLKKAALKPRKARKNPYRKSGLKQ